VVAEISKDSAQDPQFDIEDKRSVQEIIKSLKNNNFDPVFTSWRTIKNTI